MRHDAAYCPGHYPELPPKRVEAPECRDKVAAQLGVKLHGMYSTLPDQWEAAIVEPALRASSLGWSCNFSPASMQRSM